MGNECCTDRKELTKETDTKLTEERRAITRSRCGHLSFGITYTVSTVLMIIVLVTGGPVTLIISPVVTGVGAVYYIYESCLETGDITEIDKELNRRVNAEVSVIDIGKFIITTQVPASKTQKLG